MGRLIAQRVCTKLSCSTNHPQAYTYDLAGNMVSCTDGLGGTTFTQAYDAAGKLKSLTSSLNDSSHPPNLFNITDYLPVGWDKVVIGGVMHDSRVFDNCLRVNAYSVLAGAQ